MARFPQTELEIAALGMVVVQGLRRAVEDFPSPPVSADELQARLDASNVALAASVAGDSDRILRPADPDLPRSDCRDQRARRQAADAGGGVVRADGAKLFFPAQTAPSGSESK